MANEVYMGMKIEPSVTEVTGPNPAWVIAARLPAAELPQGAAKRIAVFVKGVMGHVRTQPIGTVPQRGIMQVCLGLDTGLKSTLHRQNLGIREQLLSVPGPVDGIAFSFLMVLDIASTDPEFGTTLNTTSMGDFVIWARSNWNGDPAAYSAQFRVMDVEWLWFDMDNIEAEGDHRHLTLDTPLQLTTTEQSMITDPSNLGVAGETWMTFANITYRTWNTLQSSVIFRGGSSTDGTVGNFTEKVEMGQARAMLSNTGVELSMQSQCMFWRETVAASHRTMVIARDYHTLGAPFETDRLRIKTLSVRIDQLEDFHENTGPSPVVNIAPTVGYTGSLTGLELNLERTAQANPRKPIVIMAMRWNRDPFQANGAHVQMLNGGAVITHLPQASAWRDKTRFEEMQALSFHQFDFGASLALQFKGRLLINSPANDLGDVHQAQLLMFHPVLNPTNSVTVSTWIKPADVTIVVGREAINTSSFLVLTPNPDVAQVVSVLGVQSGQITGKTGYKRTWPTWDAPRRVFQLQWQPISEAVAATLLAFLEDNTSFFFTPLHGTAQLPCSQSGPVEIEYLGDGRATLRVNVIELIYTTA